MLASRPSASSLTLAPFLSQPNIGGVAAAFCELADEMTHELRNSSLLGCWPWISAKGERR